MCQLKKGELFRIKRLKVNRLKWILTEIRQYRHMSGYQKLKRHDALKNKIKVVIIGLIGLDEMQLAKFIRSRAERAGVSFYVETNL
ncbi:hypothetical protein [Pseudoalteromonas prydzensis]|uniref:hypothetical protein n=1 Tax=Pseudoalteromonas prydzensis TaxID=182141 RepID=UPI0007E4F97E|nr:hypothetical protein [Pseudoalteromonas prydzensis]